MATPHVTGLACSILTDGTVKTPLEVIQKMLKIGEKGVITGALRNSPNILLKQVPVSGCAKPPTAGGDEEEDSGEWDWLLGVKGNLKRRSSQKDA
jgi:hypothetical protein